MDNLTSQQKNCDIYDLTDQGIEEIKKSPNNYTDVTKSISYFQQRECKFLEIILACFIFYDIF